MRKEDDHQPKELTFEQVSEMAREVMLRDGSHLPTVIVEGDRQTLISQFHEFGMTYEERSKQMFITGFMLAQTQQIRDLKQVFFISEAWMSRPEAGQLPDLPPSQDPKRIEILFISQLKIQPDLTKMVIYEMLRDEEGQFLDLREADEVMPEGTEVRSPLLAAFVAGFAHGRGDRFN